MTPGPRKRGGHRGGGSSHAPEKAGLRNPEPQPTLSNAEIPPEGDNGGNYSKRKVASNWGKYDDPVVDPHADKARGADFEILLSYSVGSQSHFQMHDEKEWEDETVSDKSLALDLQDLASVIGCIPFHCRIDVPEDIFTKAQVETFNAEAEACRNEYSSRDVSRVPAKQAAQCNLLDTKLNLIESCEFEDKMEAVAKPIVMKANMESIIDSLASCLSFKSTVEEQPEKVVAQPEEPITSSTEVPDDLDFLLSLTNCSSNNPKEVSCSTTEKTNVDDWLNSILD